MPIRNERRARYHRDLRRYVSPYREPNNWIQYAIDNKKLISSLMKAQTVCGIFLILIGIAQQELCETITGCYSTGPTECGDYYFGSWVQNGVDIWGGIMILLFGAYGWLQTRAPTYTSVATSFIMCIFGSLLTPVLIGLEGKGWAETSFCKSDGSNSLIALFCVSIIADAVSFVIFMTSTKHIGTAVHDNFICNCRSLADSDDEEDDNASTRSQTELSRRIEVRSTRVNPTSDTYSLHNYGFYHQESLPGYVNDPPPDYDTVCPPSSDSD